MRSFVVYCQHFIKMFVEKQDHCMDNLRSSSGSYALTLVPLKKKSLETLWAPSMKGPKHKETKF